MATAKPNHFLRVLTRGMTSETMTAQSDRELVAHFLARQDEAVFETLVRRHGPMVYRVCWRVLHHSQDSEDAFQATFLILAQKLRALRNRDSLASWLHGVARRVALKAQAQTASRRQHQRRVSAPEVLSPDEVTWKELRLVLDAELASLPERLRLPLILCYLEGCGQEDAARQLGWSKSTLIRRLEEARLALGRRLTRRGVSWSAALSAILLSDCVASAALPPQLVGSTVEAASLVVAGAVTTSAVSPKVGALTEGVINAMYASKLKVLAAMLLLVGVMSIWFLGTGGPVILGQEPKPSREAAKSPAEPTQSEDAKDKPKPALKPVVVSEKATIHHMAWDAKGGTVVTVGVTYEVGEIKLGDEAAKYLVPNSTIKLWDAATGELKRSLGEEKGVLIRAFAQSPDRKTAVVTTIKFTDENGKPLGGSRGTEELRLMDAEKWEMKRKIDSDGFDGPGVRALVYAVAFSPDGKTLAMGGASPRVKGGCFLKLWDVQKEKRIGGTKETTEAEGGLGEAVNSLAFSPDGKLLAAACMDGKLRLFDGRTGELKKVWDDDSGRWWVVFSPDSKTLVSQSSDKTVKVWDVEKAKVLRTLQGNKASVIAAAFSPDGKFFATGGIVRENDKVTGGEVVLWDAKTWDLKHTLPRQTMPISTLSFSPDSKTLAIAGGTSGDLKDGGKTTGEIKLFSLESLAAGEQPKTKEEKLKELIDKVLEAHGGEEKLGKLRFTEKVKQTQDGNVTTIQYSVRPPDGFRIESQQQGDAAKRIYLLRNGGEHWKKHPDGKSNKIVLTGEPLIETVLDTVKFFGPRVVMRLKDADHRLALADEIKIDGRPAVGVELSKVAPTFKVSLRLYFDKETNLLVRQDKLHEASSITYGDYKRFDDIPIAQKQTQTRHGKVVSEVAVLDFRAVDKLDAKLFEQP